MAQTNNREPRRLWTSNASSRAHVPCASCGVNDD